MDYNGTDGSLRTCLGSTKHSLYNEGKMTLFKILHTSNGQLAPNNVLKYHTRTHINIFQSINIRLIIAIDKLQLLTNNCT
jgi:hypothetical protein